MRIRLIALVAAASLSGCASTDTTSQAPSTAAPVSRPRRRASTPAHRAPATHAVVNGLPVSSASADVVQAQPAPGTCHATGPGLYSLPDPRCTPGALNPAVTQTTIGQTICVSGYTRTIRPAESVTEPEKRASMAAYGDGGPMSGYEYDHLVSLELGGAANDPRNLWPEPGASPNPKDAVEDSLHSLVCSGQMPLAQAQHIIATGWVAYAHSHRGGPAPAATGTARTAGHCRASASYSARYRDWDVYVHSDQPRTTITVTDPSGRSNTWHTDGSGYADVYFKAPVSAAGETVTARAGVATCQTSL